MPSAEFAAALVKFGDCICDILFLVLEHAFDGGEVGFEESVLGGFDDLGWVADDGAEELFFGDLFEVGEAEFGEEFLMGKRWILVA